MRNCEIPLLLKTSAHQRIIEKQKKELKYRKYLRLNIKLTTELKKHEKRATKHNQTAKTYN